MAGEGNVADTGATGRPEPGAQEQVLRNTVVVLATIRWGYLWQRHQSLAAAAADLGPVLFVESQPRRQTQLLSYPLRLRGRDRHASTTERVPPGVTLIRPSPWALLVPRLWGRRYARRIRAAAAGGGIDVLLYAPTVAYVALARRLSASGARVTYDSVVDWSAAPRHWYPPRAVRRREAALPRHWRVVSDNRQFADELAPRLRRPVAVVPPAADDAFLHHRWPAFAGRQPVIGWFGAVRDETDVALLVAASRSGLRVETVGPIEDRALARVLSEAGVTSFGPRPIADLPQAIEHWRVTVLAYRGPRAGTLTPAKLYNALTGFRVAVRGIAVPDEVAGAVTVLPPVDAEAVEALRRLAEDAAGAPSQEHRVTWHARLCELVGDR
jgi:hypothetical protein